MNDNISQVIEELAEKLGATGARLFEIMARQAFVNGIVWSAICLMLIVVIPLVAVKLARLTCAKWDEWASNDIEPSVSIAWLIGGFVGTIVFFVALLSLPDALMSIVNPEYYAIKTILEAIGK